MPEIPNFPFDHFKLFVDNTALLLTGSRTVAVFYPPTSHSSQWFNYKQPANHHWRQLSRSQLNFRELAGRFDRSSKLLAAVLEV